MKILRLLRCRPRPGAGIISTSLIPRNCRLLLVALLLFANPTFGLVEEQKTITLTETELQALIDQRIDSRLKALGIGQPVLDAQIERGILAYIAKQRARNDPSAKAKNVKPVSAQNDHIYGNPQALISLIEYSDFECPYCKRFHLTARKVVDEFDGQVNWVYRHFPLAFHNPGAQMQAEATECANEQGGNTAFWRYTDLIYARTKSNGKGFPIRNLVPLAIEIGLNDSRFKACLESGRYTAHVKQDIAEGTQAGITGTPGNILRQNTSGQVVFLNGAQPFATVKAAVEKLLNPSG